MRQIHQDGFNRRKQEQFCLEGLREKIVAPGNIDEKLYNDVTEFVQKELEGINTLNEVIKPYPLGRNNVTWQLKTNKLAFALEKTLGFLKDEKNFFKLIEGELEGFDLAAPMINYSTDIQPNTHIYASVRGLIAKIVFISCFWTTQEQPCWASLARFIDRPIAEIPFVHMTPLPTTVEDLKIESAFIDSGYLAVIHNGYTFGGHREEGDLSPETFPPEDCTSFAAKYAGCIPFATYHLVLHYQNKLGFPLTHLGDAVVTTWESQQKEWVNDQVFRPSLHKRLEPFARPEDLSKIPAGCVCAERNYKGLSSNPAIGAVGTGGHAAFFLGTVGSGPDIRALTIGANRGYPDTLLDGTYLVEERPLLCDPVKDEKMVMLFTLKSD